MDEPGEWRKLATSSALADTLRALAFGITPENVDEVIEARSQLLRDIYPIFSQFCQFTLKQPLNQFLPTLWHLWLPLAMAIASYRQKQSYPLIQGILGGQGTGKTTLAAILTLILHHLGYRTLSLSLDDLYTTYSDRLALQQQDSRLIWRGPPGTHDIELGLTVLDRLRQPNPNQLIEIPRFDKSAWGGAGDRGIPEVVEGADIILFEGWFVGVRPIDPANFDTAPPPIISPSDRKFARDMNARLQDYIPLWEKLDRLIVLYPVDYHLSQEWRKQAEHQMIATGKSGMNDAQIEQFVEYFWRSLHPDLFIKPLTKDPRWVDLVIEINRDRSVGAVYRPSDLS
ncbi:MAG TPA: glycerate kinase [Cyanobacteria bacterium UBA11049]|nr:glycerate kinase [Cyanobacteria bacterium UBA11049]